MHILIATGIFPPDIGGPATYSTLLKHELQKRNIRVDIATYGPAGISRKIPKGIRHFLYFIDCLKKSINGNIIFAQDPVSAGFPAYCAARLLGKKFAIRIAGDYAWEQARGRWSVADSIEEFQNKKYGWRIELLRIIEKYIIGHADLVITPSHYFRKLVAQWSKNPLRIETIYNGIELDESQKPITKSREKIICSAGRLVPWKGFHELISFMKELPDWQLHIIGDGPEREALESTIKTCGLGERVILLGGLSREKMFDALLRSSIFVLNTTFESFSYQLVEAMHAGLPVVVTNIGNIGEIIIDQHNGILIKPNDRQQFIAAIRAIENNEQLRAKLIKNAKETTQKFSIQKTVTQLLEKLQSLMTQ